MQPDPEEGIDARIQSNIKIYPNPINAFLTIEMQKVNLSQAIIYNHNGQQVDQFILSNTLTQRNIEALQPGIYYLSITNDENVITKKIVKF